MTTEATNQGVTFVYDGECPICSYAAHALRIKQQFGAITLVNAREDRDSPLLQEVNRLGLDLDEGMVIVAQGKFFHGADALSFMARYGQPRNLFTTFCKSLFWSESIGALMYPWMRGTRNWLLKRKSAPRIDNLNLKQAPIFEPVFGEQWDMLPDVVKKHYSIKAYTEEPVVVEGTLDIQCKAPLSWLSPFLSLAGLIPARSESLVPVQVSFHGNPNSKAFHYDRVFRFQKSKPYIFNSQLFHQSGNEVIEVMGLGFCWKCAFVWDGEKVVLQHKGYAVQLFGHFVPLPVTFLLGEGYAEEIPVDADSFDLNVSITHSWWGEVYGYKGRLKVVE